MTGNLQVDRWWVKFFNMARGRKKYNGIVFRISKEDYLHILAIGLERQQRIFLISLFLP
jgi:hypothetical protein